MDERKFEIEKKKSYLQGYGEAIRAEEVIQDEILELRNNKMHPAAKLDGMPVGSFRSADLSDYMAKVDELLDELRQVMEERITLRRDIVRKIEELQDETEKLVLRLRYIHLLKWDEVAERMCYSYKGVHKVHERAMAHFEM